jgi:hypothetical protein
VTGRRGRRRRKLLDDLKERRGYSHLKEEALDRTMWRAGFGRVFGPVVRQTAEWMNESTYARLSTIIYLYHLNVSKHCTTLYGISSCEEPSSLLHPPAYNTAL